MSLPRCVDDYRGIDEFCTIVRVFHNDISLNLPDQMILESSHEILSQ